MCSNNRGITILSIAGKVFCILVLLRIRNAADKRLRENQGGFRKGRTCADQCFALRQLVEKCHEFQLPLKINFVDFKASFDSVPRLESPWEILEAYMVYQRRWSTSRRTPMTDRNVVWKWMERRQSGLLQQQVSGKAAYGPHCCLAYWSIGCWSTPWTTMTLELYSNSEEVP